MKVCGISKVRIEPHAEKVTKKPPNIERTLALALASLKGEAVVLELKNDAEVAGTVVESDASMNITLYDATYTAVSGEARELETVFINGSSILYVHIPPNIDMKSQIGNYLIKINGIAGRKTARAVETP